MTRQCSLEDCSNPHDAKGYCATHYARFRRYGDPRQVTRLRFVNPDDSFAARTRREGECLVWTGHMNRKGYGSISDGGRERLVHRWVYERMHGLIPPGMEVDHTCHNPSCVEASHLRLASPRENVRHRSGATRSSKSGIRGLREIKGGRWEARVHDVGGTHRKSFPPHEKEAAIEWLIKTRAEVFGDFAGHPGRIEEESRP